ncbi:MAG: hypothetical protein DMF62_02570 [Acidobacteria bacterium]|nr:MAG: hypothetical protein DMF62_02570 [Acidobacteriota bacterium]
MKHAKIRFAFVCECGGEVNQGWTAVKDGTLNFEVFCRTCTRIWKVHQQVTRSDAFLGHDIAEEVNSRRRQANEP